MGDLSSDNVPNNELGAIKCLLKLLSTSNLFDTKMESTTILGGNSEEQELAEGDFIVCKNLLQSFRLSMVHDR